MLCIDPYRILTLSFLKYSHIYPNIQCWLHLPLYLLLVETTHQILLIPIKEVKPHCYIQRKRRRSCSENSIQFKKTVIGIYSVLITMTAQIMRRNATGSTGHATSVNSNEAFHPVLRDPSPLRNQFFIIEYPKKFIKKSSRRAVQTF